MQPQAFIRRTSIALSTLAEKSVAWCGHPRRDAHVGASLFSEPFLNIAGPTPGHVKRRLRVGIPYQQKGSAPKTKCLMVFRGARPLFGKSCVRFRKHVTIELRSHDAGRQQHVRATVSQRPRRQVMQVSNSTWPNA